MAGIPVALFLVDRLGRRRRVATWLFSPKASARGPGHHLGGISVSLVGTICTLRCASSPSPGRFPVGARSARKTTHIRVILRLNVSLSITSCIPPYTHLRGNGGVWRGGVPWPSLDRLGPPLLRGSDSLDVFNVVCPVPVRSRHQLRVVRWPVAANIHLPAPC